MSTYLADRTRRNLPDELRSQWELGGTPVLQQRVRTVHVAFDEPDRDFLTQRLNLDGEGFRTLRDIGASVNERSLRVLGDREDRLLAKVWELVTQVRANIPDIDTVYEASDNDPSGRISDHLTVHDEYRSFRPSFEPVDVNRERNTNYLPNWHSSLCVAGGRIGNTTFAQPCIVYAAPSISKREARIGHDDSDAEYEDIVFSCLRDAQNDYGADARLYVRGSNRTPTSGSDWRDVSSQLRAMVSTRRERCRFVFLAGLAGFKRDQMNIRWGAEREESLCEYHSGTGMLHILQQPQPAGGGWI